MTPNKYKNQYIDPVCRMIVTDTTKIVPYVFHSDTYFFCSNSCREAFMADPLNYVQPEPKKRKSIWRRYLDRLNKTTGGKPQCCH